MNSYFNLQLKRITKILPFVLGVTVLLFVGFAVVLYSLMGMFNGKTKTEFTVAVSGDTDNEYMRWGLAAVKTFDDSNFSIKFEQMDEKSAQSALETGKISAYVIIPDGFVENAMHGDVLPITYVTSAGMETITSLFKREITELATELVVYSQKGTYGVGEAMWQNGYSKTAGDHMTTIALKYTDLIFNRGKLYSVTESGMSHGLTTPEYYVCAVIIMLLMLVGLPFAAVFIKKDYSFNRLLLSRGMATGKQVFCEYVAVLFGMLLQTAVVIAGILLATRLIPGISDGILPSVDRLIINIVPVLLMVCAFNLMMFELSGNIVSGLLLHFFVTVGLCYISGCIYPIYTFPDTVKNIASMLPTGASMNLLASGFTNKDNIPCLATTLGFAVIFFVAAWALRRHKSVRIRG